MDTARWARWTVIIKAFITWTATHRWSTARAVMVSWKLLREFPWRFQTIFFSSETGKIVERFFLHALDRYWHNSCLKCSCCGAMLADIGTSCFTKSGMILCKADYSRWVAGFFWRFDGKNFYHRRHCCVSSSNQTQTRRDWTWHFCVWFNDGSEGRVSFERPKMRLTHEEKY